MVTKGRSLEMDYYFLEYLFEREKSFLRDIMKNLKETSYEKERLWYKEQLKNGKSPIRFGFDYNRVESIEKLESWISENIAKEQQKDFEYHLEQFALKAIIYCNNPKWIEAGYKEKISEVKKYKNFIKKAKEFSFNFLEDTEERFENPARDIRGYLVNTISECSEDGSRKRKNFVQFREDFSKKINCLEKAILSYEENIVKKKKGNKFKSKNHFITLAVVAVLDNYLPDKLNKTRKLENPTPLYSLLEIVLEILGITHKPDDLKHLISDAINSYQKLVKKNPN